MRTSALISLVALASSTVALPRGRRADSAKASDADITVFRTSFRRCIFGEDCMLMRGYRLC
jgi:hypothetical protein